MLIVIIASTSKTPDSFSYSALHELNSVFYFRNMDLKTGFRTRSILCQPVRGMRGGGAIIGVIQMLNKIGGDGTFDINDEDMLFTFTGKVADILSVRFTDLINIADKFSGELTWIILCIIVKGI